MNMNMSGVIKGGLLAGLVLNIGEILLNTVVVGAQWEAVATDLGLEQSGLEMAYYVTGGFVLGIVGVWLYAAARPRLGAGPGTAIKVGLVMWALGWAWPMIPFMITGLFPSGLMIVALSWAIVELPLAVTAGAWLYKEDGGDATAA